jgi:hypothetical protein
MKSRPDYHHGDLARALVDASVTLVRDEGLDRFSLRAASRATSVDPALSTGTSTIGLRCSGRWPRSPSPSSRTRWRTPWGRRAMTPAGFGAAGRCVRPARDRGAGAVPSHVQPVRGGRAGTARRADHGAGRAGCVAVRPLVGLVGSLMGPEAARESVERAAVTAWSGVHGLAHLAVNGVLDSSSDLDEAVADVVSGLERSLSRGRSDRPLRPGTEPLVSGASVSVGPATLT